MTVSSKEEMDEIITKLKNADFTVEEVKKGEWYGMIKFGSQVDIILPINCNIKIALKQQVYAKKTIIAEW